jgi:hypothetical protein
LSRVIRASGSTGLTRSAFETRLPARDRTGGADPRAASPARWSGELAQHRLPAAAIGAPHDRAHGRVRLPGRGVDADPATLDQAARRQQPQHQPEHRGVDLERQPGAAPRKRAVIGHRIARAEPQELPQRQAIGAAPGDPALAVQAFEVTHEQHPEVAPGRDRRPSHARGAMRRAAILDPAVEPGLIEHHVQPVVKHVPGRARRLLPAN